MLLHRGNTDAPCITAAHSGPQRARCEELPMSAIEPDTVQLRPPSAVAAQVGVSVRHLRRMVREGIAPTPVQISKQRVGFYAHEVAEWLSSLPRTREAA